MGYVIAGLLVLIVVAAGVAVVMARLRRHEAQGERTADDPAYGGSPGDETAIFAPDRDAPLGDTTEHAGQQEDGVTVDDETGVPGDARHDQHGAPPLEGGEAEGRRRV